MRGFSDSSKGNAVASRASSARWVLVLVFAVLAFRLVHLQLVEHERYQELAGEDQQVTKWIVDLKRRISAAQRTANVTE